MTYRFTRSTRAYGWALLLSAGVLTAACKTPPGLSEAQIAALREAGFHKEDAGWELDFEGLLLFGSNNSELSDKSRETIARAVRVLMSIGIGRVRVEGYADNTGSALGNQRLSQQRAEAVAREMERNGLPRGSITTIKGFGANNPVGNNATREGRAQNRRVAIIIEVEG